ncbi:hypothetical protein HGH92_17350 [Chitinophaga varians]|uniref:Uncharacterized protein n=1 Tax=Chitinophaga varians TaxID=2202339 RepID=A0A847RZL4_9BACT|nr:hypothetical protein [Chitinophaga varians]NLR66077.1 hypothetical protein [Chitinophaga varians]
MKLKTDALHSLKDKLLNWQQLSEQELETYIREFEKIPRAEVSTFYTPVLSDNELGAILVAIGIQFPDNVKLQINVVSALGNMVWRYGLTPTDAMFDYLVAASGNRKVNFYVALHIRVFPQYQTWAKRWEYLLSVPDIAPRKKAIVVFYDTVKQQLEKNDPMTLEVKLVIIKKIQAMLNEEDLHPYLKDEYLATLSAIVEQ